MIHLRMIMRQIAITAAALIVGVAAGWVTRGATPARVEYRDRVEFRDREVGGQSSATTIARVEGPVIRIVSRETKAPDGTVTKTTEKTQSGGTKSTVAKVETKVEYRDRTEYRDREVVRVAPAPLPTWRVSVHGGATLVEPLISIPGAPRAVVGASLERRVAGPLWAGAWANTSGAAGLSVGVMW